MKNKIFFFLIYFLVLFDFLFFNIDVGIINITLLRVILFGLLLYYILSHLSHKKLIMSTEAKGTLMFFVVWLLYLFVTLIWVPDTSNVFKGAYYLSIFVILIYVLIKILNTSAIIVYMERVIYYSTVIIVVLGMFEYLTSFRFKASRYNLVEFMNVLEQFNTNAVTGMFHNENNYSLFLALCLPFVLLGLIKEGKIKFVLSISTISAIFFLVLMNGAKLILIMMALQMIIFVILINISRLKKILLISIISFTAIVVAVLEGSIFANFSKIGVQLQVESGSSFIRLNLMKNISYSLSETNYLGAGVANYGYYLNPLLNFHGIVNPHNWWGELITEHGIIIFILFVTMFFWILWKLYNIYKVSLDKVGYTALALLISLLGFIIGSMSPSSVFFYWPMWLFIGMALSIINVNSIEQIKDREKTL